MVFWKIDHDDDDDDDDDDEWFCGMVDKRNVFSLISSQDHFQTSLPSWIYNMPQAGFELWSCAVVITR